MSNDPNRWPAGEDPAPEYRDPGHSPNTYNGTYAVNPAPRGSTAAPKKGMPGWAWFLLALGVLGLLALALVLWAAVTLGAQESAPEPVAPPAPVAEPVPTTEPEQVVDEDEQLRELNAGFPDDQEAYLDGLLEDARPAYMDQNNQVLVAMGLGACLLLEQGLPTATVLDRLPAEFSDAETGYIVGHAVRHLCPENIPAVEADLGGSLQQ